MYIYCIYYIYYIYGGDPQPPYLLVMVMVPLPPVVWWCGVVYSTTVGSRNSLYILGGGTVSKKGNSIESIVCLPASPVNGRENSQWERA